MGGFLQRDRSLGNDGECWECLRRLAKEESNVLIQRNHGFESRRWSNPANLKAGLGFMVLPLSEKDSRIKNSRMAFTMKIWCWYKAFNRTTSVWKVRGCWEAPEMCFPLSALLQIPKCSSVSCHSNREKSSFLSSVASGRCKPYFIFMVLLLGYVSCF